MISSTENFVISCNDVPVILFLSDVGGIQGHVVTELNKTANRKYPQLTPLIKAHYLGDQVVGDLPVVKLATPQDKDAAITSAEEWLENHFSLTASLL